MENIANLQNVIIISYHCVISILDYGIPIYICLFFLTFYYPNLFFYQNPVGPGRYDVQKWYEKQHQSASCSAFNSTSAPPNIQRTKLLRYKFLNIVKIY